MENTLQIYEYIFISRTFYRKSAAKSAFFGIWRTKRGSDTLQAVQFFRLLLVLPLRIFLLKNCVIRNSISSSSSTLSILIAAIMISSFLTIPIFQDLVPCKIKHQTRGHKTDDATHADVRQEVLGKVDP